MRDPALRPLIVRGYKRLAFIVIVAALIMTPTLVYGIVAARISLAVLAVGGAGLCAYLYAKGIWSAQFASATAILSMLTMGVAWALGQHGPNAELVKNVLALLVLCGMFFILPRLARRPRSRPRV